MAGTIYLRVAYTAIKAGIEKTIAVLKSTSFFCIFLNAPTKAEAPTTKREYAVAVTGLIANK